MAKLKMLKYPKKPKQSASVAVLENYLRKVREVDQENRKRKAENDKQARLAKTVANLRPGSSRISSGKTRRKKASVGNPKRKTGSRKSSARKRRR